MSRRDTYWFIAGAASGLMVGALGIYSLVGTVARGSAPETNTSDSAGAHTANAGSLDAFTRTLAQRLATKGGTDDEWRLLAQSYDYMGRTNDARAARMHVATDAGDKTNATSVDSGSPPVGAAEDSRISGTIQIDARLAAQAAPGTTLFIYAMDPASPGPPLAVLRLRVERWPVSFVLDDADAMIPGRNLSAAKSIQLEARISPSGDALPRPGDLVGRLSAVDPHTQHPVSISIDRKIT